MEIPSLITVRGAYLYLMGLLLALALLFALYIVAALFGFAPGPQELVPGGANWLAAVP